MRWSISGRIVIFVTEPWSILHNLNGEMMEKPLTRDPSQTYPNKRCNDVTDNLVNLLYPIADWI